ncbi:MAG: immunoglobulin domain-containing protein [Phycisphaerales bacterium]|nr:immunoglobulin domain-containing protein [Phycisphaerales bacterium]
MRIGFTTAVVCGLVAVAAGQARGQAPVFADSVADFSGAQGDQNWSYGFYDGDTSPWTPGDFEAFPTFDAGAGPVWYRQLGPGGYWTAVNAVALHPNAPAAIDNRVQEENWAVRRWVSSVSGLVRVRGHVADVAAEGGDGTTCKIFSGGVEVWSHSMDDGDLAGADFDLSLCLTAGQPIDFVLTPRGETELSDGNFFTAVVQGIIAEEPQDKYACDGQPATFSVAVEGPGSYTFQWRRNGVDLPGQTGPSLTISGATSEDAGEYDCVVSDACGSTTSSAAVLGVCQIDLNCDTFVDFLDYLEYLNRYDGLDPAADLNQDGFIDFVDYLEFLNLYNAGCGGE